MIYKFLFNKMAKRKRKRRTHKGLSAPARRTKGRRRRRSKGLGDIFNPTMAMNSLKHTGAGALGGFGAMIVNKSILPAESGKLVKLGTGLGVSFVLHNMNMPGMGAGFMGGMIATAFPNGLLGDDDNANFAEEDSLSEAPIFLDEEGNPMVLDEGDDGQTTWRYLSEAEFAQYEEVQ